MSSLPEELLRHPGASALSCLQPSSELPIGRTPNDPVTLSAAIRHETGHPRSERREQSSPHPYPPEAIYCPLGPFARPAAILAARITRRRCRAPSAEEAIHVTPPSVSGGPETCSEGSSISAKNSSAASIVDAGRGPMVLQRRPARNKTSRIRTTNPRPPLGRYPQSRLWGQVGSVPTSMRITIMSHTVPSISSSFRGPSLVDGRCTPPAAPETLRGTEP